MVARTLELHASAILELRPCKGLPHIVIGEDINHNGVFELCVERVRRPEGREAEELRGGARHWLTHFLLK